MQILKLIKYLDKKFSPKLAAEWDFIGFQILDKKYTVNPNKEIKNIVVCMDVTIKVVDKAIKAGADLIISRHPFIFGDLEIEKKNPAKKEMIKRLLEEKIDVYSIHTNYDASPNNGLVEMLTNALEINQWSRFGKEKEGFKIKLNSMTKLSDLKKQLISSFGSLSPIVNANWKDELVTNEFIIVTGAGGSSMIDEQLHDAVYITGEMKWNEWIYSNDNHNQVLGLGHYMENYFVDHLTDMLSNFDDLDVLSIDINDQTRKGE